MLRVILYPELPGSNKNTSKFHFITKPESRQTTLLKLNSEPKTYGNIVTEEKMKDKCESADIDERKFTLF